MTIKNVTIFEFDENHNFIQRIEAMSANISSLKWSLENVKIMPFIILENSKS